MVNKIKNSKTEFPRGKKWQLDAVTYLRGLEDPLHELALGGGDYEGSGTHPHPPPSPWQDATSAAVGHPGWT